ncbi:MAG: nicotinate-nucleotide--dimethylbenzimidazole phosphoribosyltransferase, partial [Clostridia bacterium]|nr:nicotinate-nucleotide--dimethylbenzimidazole phosphoribosyltransferase [Clostridia bacterium]
MMSTTDAKTQYVLETIASIAPADETFRGKAREQWNACAKPLGSLGVLEGMVTDLCTLEQTLTPDLGKRVAVIFCADNGVVAEGVAQTGQEVTRLVANQLAAGRSSVNRMASVAGVEVLPVDIGMLPPDDPGDVPANLRQCAVAPGTANLMHGPDRIETTGKAKGLVARGDNASWKADGMDLQHVEVTLLDTKGRRIQTDDDLHPGRGHRDRRRSGAGHPAPRAGHRRGEHRRHRGCRAP